MNKFRCFGLLFGFVFSSLSAFSVSPEIRTWPVETLSHESKLVQMKDVACVVADPTGTPLNVRTTTKGKIIGKLQNGTHVMIPDADGDEWTSVKIKKSGKWKYYGVVVKRYLNCHY